MLVMALIIIMPDSEARNRYFRFFTSEFDTLQCSDTISRYAVLVLKAAIAGHVDSDVPSSGLATVPEIARSDTERGDH